MWERTCVMGNLMIKTETVLPTGLPVQQCLTCGCKALVLPFFCMSFNGGNALLSAQHMKNFPVPSFLLQVGMYSLLQHRGSAHPPPVAPCHWAVILESLKGLTWKNNSIHGVQTCVLLFYWGAHQESCSTLAKCYASSIWGKHQSHWKHELEALAGWA